ncbi:MAG: NUDIX hydrolase [Desulfobulbaceae bacterium]|jgi:ADP-ribose pyrophosphatase YjhB (NUDIX family)|nr:NUDIX hydrolase [Desulfobulbaceae bacterium]MDY0350307.1 NUDIX hydrolase [Desulfobulbaceae bacterium]
MNNRKRKYCRYCGGRIRQKQENGIPREYCPACRVFFYDNPLPVVSMILVEERRVLLVKRKNRPYRGKWCLPSGFAETGESILDAAVRELEEETGIQGRIVQLRDVDSCSNSFYGDLLFLTFEMEQTGGVLQAGDDAEAVRFFPLTRVPRLAFPSNSKALQAYLEGKKDHWAIVDSFTLAADEAIMQERRNLLSDRLVALIEASSDHIARLWLKDVRGSRSTPTYHLFDQELLYHRVFLVISHFSDWLSGSYHGQNIISYYMHLGRNRKREGFGLSEVISALSLTKKHLWEFALSQGMWDRPIDIYTIMELERRISLFFDRATYHVAKGYELESSRTTPAGSGK